MYFDVTPYIGILPPRQMHVFHKKNYLMTMDMPLFFQGNHAWVPIGVNWSTPYHLRVTPVRRDGVAGSPRTSKWITTLSGW